jgi:uncharacterized repeat protein (TIGR02543 family)
MAALLFVALAMGGCDSPSGGGGSYTVSFDADGGDPAPQSQSVASGGRAAEPGRMVKDGHILAGWYLSPTAEDPWDFALDTVTGNITLYAKWAEVVPGSFVVSFDPQGGSPAPLDQAVADGGLASPPSPAPSKEGFVPDGWYTEAELKKRWDFSSSTVTESVTLYAKWVAVPPGKVVATFDAQGGSPAPAAQAVNSGAKLTRPSSPDKTGYSLAGWYPSLAADAAAWDFARDAATENITLYARWEARLYTVSFNSNGGGSVGSQTVAYGNRAAEPETPVNGSLILDGWYKEAALTNKWEFATDTVRGATTLYAKWVEVPAGSYLVSFNSNGGSSVESQTVAENGKAAEPAPPTRDRYVFDLWLKEDGGTEVWDFDADTVTAKTTLYARWIPLWTVTFNAQQGGAVSPITDAKNGEVIAKPGDPLREGYRFAGWYKEAAGTNAWNFETDTVARNTTLYAKWIRVWTVVFDTHDGSPVADADVLNGEAVAKPADPTLENCVFEGWYTEAAYANKWDFAADTVTAGLTLHARWTVTVSFNAGGGSPEPAAQTLTRGSRVAKPADPVLAGQTFTGWYKEAAKTNPWNFDADTVNASTVIHAGWDFVPVADISNVPANGVSGIPEAGLAPETLNLSGAVVSPANASYKTITWTVKDGGTTGLTAASVEPFTPTGIGTLKLTATIANGSGAGVDYTKDFDLTITRIRKITGISVGVTHVNPSRSGNSTGDTIDLTAARITPSNATRKTIEWSVKSQGAGVSAIGPDKIVALTAGGTLVLTAKVEGGTEDDGGNIVDYTQDLSFTVDWITSPGGFGLGDQASPIMLRGSLNGTDLGQLSRDAPIEIVRGAEYRVSLDGEESNYSDIVWYLNGTEQTIGGSGYLMYLPTAEARTVNLAVIAKKGGVINDSGSYTFVVIEAGN